MTLGQSIAAARHALGLTQQELAVRAAVSLQTVRFLEQGRRQPTQATARRLCVTLGIDLDIGGLRRVRPLRCGCGARHSSQGRCKRCYDRMRRG